MRRFAAGLKGEDAAAVLGRLASANHKRLSRATYDWNRNASRHSSLHMLTDLSGRFESR